MVDMLLNHVFFLTTTTTSERLQEGLIALISGMATVFVILIAISLIITLFKYIKSGEIVHPHEQSKITAVVETKQHENDEKKDETELVAVITAAIAASLNTTSDQLQVKSFRRIPKKNQYSR
jgi:sodium pump decarboxylase gamma subunit